MQKQRQEHDPNHTHLAFSAISGKPPTHEEMHCRPSKKMHLFERLRPVDEDWWNDQVSEDKGGLTPPDSPEGTIYPLPDEFREDLEEYTAKWDDVDMEFENG